MITHKFHCTIDYDTSPKSIHETTVETESLGDVISAFEQHLKGCGFQLNGSLEIVSAAFDAAMEDKE